MSEVLATTDDTSAERAAATLRLAANNRRGAEKPTPHAQATRLLSHILAKLHDLDTPVVQIVPCSDDLPCSDVARALSMASLHWLGRTLLVELANMRAETEPVQETDFAETKKRRRGRPFRDTAGVRQDSRWPDLFHARIAPGTHDMRAGVPPVVWLGELRVDFRMMIIGCCALQGNPTGVQLVPRCHGTILVVKKGWTTLAEIRQAARHVQLGGGTVLGTVFHPRPALPALAVQQEPHDATAAREIACVGG